MYFTFRECSRRSEYASERAEREKLGLDGILDHYILSAGKATYKFLFLKTKLIGCFIPKKQFISFTHA